MRKPSDRAFMLAYLLREAYQKIDFMKRTGFTSDVAASLYNYYNTVIGANRHIMRLTIEDLNNLKSDNVNVQIGWFTFRASITQSLRENCTISDEDYKAIFLGLSAGQWDEVRRTVGFSTLVPVFESHRVYCPADPTGVYKWSDSECDNMADMTWQEAFESNGSPVLTAVMRRKVSMEAKALLAQDFNIAFVDEVIDHLEFNNDMLDAWVQQHFVAEDIVTETERLCYIEAQAAEVAYEKVVKEFGYSEEASEESNAINIAVQLIPSWDIILGKEERDFEERLLLAQEIVQSIIALSKKKTELLDRLLHLRAVRHAFECSTFLAKYKEALKKSQELGDPSFLDQDDFKFG